MRSLVPAWIALSAAAKRQVAFCRRQALTMVRHLLLLGLIYPSACTEPLPEAPSDCVGAECGCQSHTDCPLDRPQCLVGACIESDNKEIAWAHRRHILPGSGALHTVDLGVPIDLHKARLIYHQAEQEDLGDSTAAQQNWVVLDGPEGDRVLLHKGGLVVMSSVADTAPVWLPVPAMLKPKGPGVNADLRSLVNYAYLRGLVVRMTEVGMISSQNPIRLVNDAAHRVELDQPLHLLISDVLGPGYGEPERISMGVQMDLLKRAHAFPPASTLANPIYPSEEDLPRFVGREINLRLTAAGTLRSHAIIVPDPPCAGQHVTVSVQIDDEAPRQWLPHAAEHRKWDLTAGSHRIRFSFPFLTACDQTRRPYKTHWLRFSVQSDEQIDLISWLPMMPLSGDDNARPVLYNEAAGLLVDTDGDWWPDTSDVCPRIPDDQRDGDQDGVGDVCDGLYALRLDDGELLAFDAEGELQRTIEDANFSKRSFAQVMRAPSVAVGSEPFTVTNYPGTEIYNPHAHELAVVSQTKGGEPTLLYFVDAELDGAIPGLLRLSGEETSDVTDLYLRGVKTLGPNVVFGYDVLGLRDISYALLFNYTLMSKPGTTGYIYTGTLPAFVLAPAHHPAVLFAGENLDTTAFAATRLQARRLLDDPTRLTLPYVSRQKACASEEDCSGPSQCRFGLCTTCTDRCATVDDDGQPLEMQCMAGLCLPADGVGVCLARDASRSSFTRCRSARAGERCQRDTNCGSDDMVCVMGHCLGSPGAGDSLDCPEGNSCVPHVALERMMTIFGYDIDEVIRSKALGVVQPLPMVRPRHEGLILTACLRELVGPESTGQLTLSQQRSILRRLFNPMTPSEAIFEVAERLTDGLGDPSIPCLGHRLNWRAHFPATLTPVTADMVDTDGDGIDEIRIGFTLGLAARGAEPSVYRCYNYAAQEREQNCAPR